MIKGSVHDGCNKDAQTAKTCDLTIIMAWNFMWWKGITYHDFQGKRVPVCHDNGSTMVDQCTRMVTKGGANWIWEVFIYVLSLMVHLEIVDQLSTMIPPPSGRG